MHDRYTSTLPLGQRQRVADPRRGGAATLFCQTVQSILARLVSVLAQQTRLRAAVLKKNPPFGTWCSRNGGRHSRPARCKKVSRDEAEVLLAVAETQCKAEGVRQIVRAALTPWRPRSHVLPPFITVNVRHDFIRCEGERPALQPQEGEAEVFITQFGPQ